MERNIEALIAYIEARLTRPFSWDGNCCVSFVHGAISAQFGAAPPIGATWKTHKGALLAVHKLGGIADTCDRLFRPIAPGQAKRGDIAGVEDAALGITLMLVDGMHLIGPGDRGLVRIPRKAMTGAWSAEPQNV